MSGEVMEAEDTVAANKGNSGEDLMEVNNEEMPPNNEGEDLTDGTNISVWPLKCDTDNGNIHSSPNNDVLSKKSGTKNITSSSNAADTPKNSEMKNMWSIRSPFAMKHNCPHTIVRRRQSNETYPPIQEDEHLNTAKLERQNVIRNSFHFNSSISPSAFVPNRESRPRPFMDDDLESNILKRCNSAPILNDADDGSVDWSRPIASSAGRIRRFSANVVSVNSSPSSSTAKTRLRLHQLKKEESLEGIQSKETAHEREVQATIQISSNCGDLSLGDRRSSLDSCLSSPRSTSSSTSFPPLKHFPTPPSAFTGGKSSHSRAIDFSAPACSGGTLSPTSQPPHPSPHLPTSGGIPSPLTFSPSPCLLTLSPLPPSPTRGICGPGKQCFSPSMQVPVSLARATSRSPSPSPTRRTFVTRRRSQSPCIMRPSALGPIKRKYDSDSEGSCSPKRIFLNNPSHVALSGGSGDAHMALSNITPARSLIHRSHSLSSSSVDSSDLYVSPSPPHQGPTFVTHHHGNHAVTGLLHPLHHSSSPMHPGGVAVPQITLDHPNRSLSPASSTCSSSSLEGLRDLPPLNSTRQTLAEKKS